MEQNQSLVSPSILSMSVDSCNEVESEYRIQFGNKVKYLTIAPVTFDVYTLWFPLASLPPLPYSDDSWNLAHISRDADSGELRVSLSDKQLAGVQNVWHDVQVDVLDLEMEHRTCRAFEVVVREMTDSTTEKGCPFPPQFKAMAKMARFEWEIPDIERETRAYQLLYQKDPTLGPQFLGHIREGNRVIGVLIEKLEGRRSASIGDLHNCEKALKRFHNLGLLHGDVNRYNFLVGDDEVALIDFETSTEEATEEAKLLEMQSLPAQLVKESALGAGFMCVTKEEEEELDRLTRMANEKVEALMRKTGKKAEEIGLAH